MTNDKTNNIIAFVAIFSGVLIIAGFIAALLGSHSGEAAGALGGVLGGAIGAGGAGYSVYYSLRRQREDEQESTSRAVLTEFAVILKYIVGHLNLCEMINGGGYVVERIYLTKLMLTPEPIIYKASADKISRLPRPTQVIEFYTRLAEMENIVAVIANTPILGANVHPEEVVQLADLLITQLQVAQAVLSNVQSIKEDEEILSNGVRSHWLAAITKELVKAKTVFPKADSFKK